MTRHTRRGGPESPKTHEFDLVRLRHCMRLSAHEKLRHLAEKQEFLHRVMPARNRQIAVRLRRMGF